MKKPIAIICVLAATLAVCAPATAKKKKTVVVKSAISFTFTPPTPGQRTVTISGRVTGARGCQAGRTAQLGALSGGSAPPTVPIAFAADGSFRTTYTVSGPTSVEVFTALLPSKRKRAGKKFTCGSSVFQATIPFS